MADRRDGTGRSSAYGHDAALDADIAPEVSKMSVFMVDRHLPGITLEQLADAQRAAIDTSTRFTAEGKAVRYIRSTWVPGDSRVMCLFEGAEAELVKQVNDAAGIPYTRVVEARDLTP
jgi:uncharacterized protein DUF4242